MANSGGVAVHLIDGDDRQVNNEASNVVHLSEEDLAQGRVRRNTLVEQEEFVRRTTEKGKLDAGRTVRSGYAYDFDSTDEVRPRDVERAERLREELGDEPLHGIEDRYAYRFIKRTFDVAFSIAIIVLFSWLYILIAILVKLDDPKGPVFFKQKRVGWSIIGQKSGAVSDYALRPALSALEAWRLRHSYQRLGVAA